jgi:UDP-3-O-[3-hydroxymyristoyl] N-acetylglucosamine deacetylase
MLDFVERLNEVRMPALLAASTSRVASPVRQRTLKSSIECTGIGLHSGVRVAMVLRPAPVNSGIVFRRTDIPGGLGIPALWSSVGDTRFNTSLCQPGGVCVKTVEHLMAAFAGLAIDNAVIEIDGPEIPAMDGSSAPFLFLMECAGVVEQDAPRRAIRVLKRVSVEGDDWTASLSPSSSFSVQIEIDFAASAIRRQSCRVTLANGAFKSEISRARTFGFEQEVLAMRAAGLGLGGSLDNVVVISSDGRRVLNQDGLRYVDEFVRHKALDAIGDLYLAGAPIIGSFSGVRSGHKSNFMLLKALFADPEAWEPVLLDSRDSLSGAGLISERIAAAPV